MLITFFERLMGKRDVEVPIVEVPRSAAQAMVDAIATPPVTPQHGGVVRNKQQVKAARRARKLQRQMARQG